MRVFKEDQRFTQLWIIVLVAVSTLIPLGIVLNHYTKNPQSFTTIELMGIIALIVFASGIIFFFKLSTRIDENGISYKFSPFHVTYRQIKWHDIDKIYVRQYDAISEYGGWGLKGGALWKKSKGVAINVSGDIGIQLELINGKKILIGTQKKNEAIQVIETYNHRIKKAQDG